MVLKKCRLVINRNKHLGDLLLLKLLRGDHCLKMSFKNKVGPTLKKYGPHFKTLRELDFTKPTVTKQIPAGQTLEVDYFFEKSKLEVKQEIKDGEVARSFYNVATPIECYLFTIIIRNINNLNDINEAPENLLLNHVDLGEQIALIFSFEGIDGKPIMNPLIKPQRGNHIVLDLPDMRFDKLHIAVTNDDNPMAGNSDFLLTVPYRPTKVT